MYYRSVRNLARPVLYLNIRVQMGPWKDGGDFPMYCTDDSLGYQLLLAHVVLENTRGRERLEAVQ
jgi:hypothetical protein